MKMKKVLSVIGVVIIAAVIVAGITLSRKKSQKESIPIKIGYLPMSFNLPLYVALEQGYFSDQGLEVETVAIPSGTLIIDALVSGRIDVNGGSAITGHWFAELNSPGTFKTFMVTLVTGETDCRVFIALVKKDAPYQRPEDLKGKCIGTFPGATSVCLGKIIMRHFLDPEKDITFVEIPPANQLPALATGQVDALLTLEPMGIIGASKGISRYFIDNPLQYAILPYTGAAHSFSTKFLRARPREAYKVLRAYERALDFIHNNEPEARKCLAKYTSLPESLVNKLPLAVWPKLADIDRQQVQRVADLFYQEGLYPRRLDTTELYYEPRRR